jgi:hypothetical protein
MTLKNKAESLPVPKTVKEKKKELRRIVEKKEVTLGYEGVSLTIPIPEIIADNIISRTIFSVFGLEVCIDVADKKEVKK